MRTWSVAVDNGEASVEYSAPREATVGELIAAFAQLLVALEAATAAEVANAMSDVSCAMLAEAECKCGGCGCGQEREP